MSLSGIGRSASGLTAATVEVTPSGKIINESDGLGNVPGYTALPQIPKSAKKKKSAAQKGSALKGSAASAPDGGEVGIPKKVRINAATRKPSSSGKSKSGSSTRSGNESSDSEQVRKPSKKNLQKTLKKLVKSSSRTRPGRSRSRSKSNENKSGERSTGTFSSSFAFSDTAGSASTALIRAGSSGSKGQGLNVATSVNNRKSASRARAWSAASNHGYDGNPLTQPPKPSSKTSANSRPSTNSISSASGSRNQSSKSKVKNDQKRNKNSEPSHFKTITPEFFSRLKKIANASNAQNINNSSMVKGRKDQKAVPPSSEGKVQMESLTQEAREAGKKASDLISSVGVKGSGAGGSGHLTFNEAREALSLKHVQVFPNISIAKGGVTFPEGQGPTMKDTDLDAAGARAPGSGEMMLTKSKSMKMFQSEIKGLPINPLHHSQTRRLTMATSGGGGGGGGGGQVAKSISSAGTNKPILCHGSGCHSSTFSVKKKHLRFADSDVSHASHVEVESSSSCSNNTKRTSSNLIGGCLK